MEWTNRWTRYLDKEDIKFVGIANILYEENFDEMRQDLYGRLLSKPMYPALKNQLTKDIERIDKIIFYRDIDEFIQRRIFNDNF